MSINFVLIGQVDHGKTTCAGRILVETGVVSDREVEKSIIDATNNGMRSWWLAYLLDMGEERIKGKTYEHTVVPLEYKGTQLNMIDVPGHRKFVREMIAGTSQANLAVLICSAKKGELESGIKGQTMEHLLLARGMGIAKLVVAVNKMDTVEWDSEVYGHIKTRLDKLLEPLNFIQIQYVPISALDGINVADKDNGVTVTGEPKSNLLDVIVNTKINFNRVIKLYESQTKIKVKVAFTDIESLITIGYTCNLHSAHSVVGCTLNKLYHKRPFITSADKEVITVDLTLDEPTDIKTFVILRDGDKTVGIGKMIETD